MRKEERLSFRIPQELKDKIEQVIKNSDGKIRNHSEFGTKAVKFYLDYISHAQAAQEIMYQAVVALADKTGVQSSEINKIMEILEESSIYPSTPASGLAVDEHPLIEKISEIRNLLDEKQKDKLAKEMMSATYNDIPKIYEKYKKLAE